jgi:protein-disulfide isomerase
MANPSFTSPRSTKRERRERARAARLTAERAAGARATRKRRLVLLAAATCAVALAMAGLVLLGGRDGTADAVRGDTPAGVVEVRQMLAGVPQDGIALGEPEAPVTLVEFADLQCPFCRDFALQALPLVVRDYVRAGKVRLEFQALAFLGPDSERGARAVAGAAAQDRLWNVVDLFYFNQGRENSGYATDAFLDGLLAAVPGLDAGRVRRDGSAPAADRLLGDAEALAARHGIDSTPSFLIGRTGSSERRVVAGVEDYEALREQIDALAPR